MTELQLTTKKIEAEKTKLFDGIYSHHKFHYDEEYDELSTSIGAVIGNTQYSFSVNIEPAIDMRYSLPFGKKMYKINVQEFGDLRDSAIVSGELLLDFLLKAKIQIRETSPKLKLIYTHSRM